MLVGLGLLLRSGDDAPATPDGFVAGTVRGAGGSARLAYPKRWTVRRSTQANATILTASGPTVAGATSHPLAQLRVYPAPASFESLSAVIIGSARVDAGASAHQLERKDVDVPGAQDARRATFAGTLGSGTPETLGLVVARTSGDRALGATLVVVAPAGSHVDVRRILSTLAVNP